MAQDQSAGARVYFPGLNGLRFIAASTVIVEHLENYRDAFTTGSTFNADVGSIGFWGVGLFFVLSGFLITYLLLQEHAQTGTINVKEFYLRRVFRIWPLYYLVGVTAFFLFSHYVDYPRIGQHDFFGTFYQKLFLFFLLLPNVARAFYPTVIGFNQAWSVGVEEQFYLIWPHVLKRYIHRLIPVLAIIIVGKVIFFQAGLKLMYFIGNRMNSPSFLLNGDRFFDVVDWFQIEMLAMGAIGARLAFDRSPYLEVFFHPVSQMLCFLLVAVTFFYIPPSPFHGVIEGVIFLTLILNVACNPNSLLKLENKFFNSMGKISYGFYLYHTIISYCMVHVFKGTFMIFTSTFALTVLVSGLSYKYFESYFLNLKKKHALVQSG